MYSQFSAWLQQVVAKTRIKFFDGLSPDDSWLYVASSPEYFNSLIMDRLKMLQAQYGFWPVEHGDWVDPGFTYFTPGRESLDGFSGARHPLNSWILKDPVALVPSLLEMEELTEHLEMIAGGMASKATPISIFTSEELHERYVKEACLQLRSFEMLLQVWRDVHQPRGPEECQPTLSRGEIRKVITLQKLNVSSAKTISKKLFRSCYPQFLLDRCSGALSRESSILNQLENYLRYSS